MLQSEALRLRAANADDTPLILTLIRELAEYERLADAVVASEAQLRANLFGARPQAEVVIAEWAGQPAGFALFFHNFSTFRGRQGLYLEDLFVRPEFRKRGIGRQVLQHLAALAEQRGCGRFEWAVLDWNVDAQAFYRSLGADCVSEWRIFRIDGERLAALAAGRPTPVTGG